MGEKVYHREVQRFRQKVLWTIVIIVDVILLSAFSYDLYQRIVLRKVVSEPVTDVEAWIIWILFGIATPLLITSLFLTKLVVEIREKGLYLRFFPFAKHFIPYNEIAAYEVCQFSPFWDFGGLGGRWIFGGWAYTVSGNSGIKVRLKNNKVFVIGSQHPEKLVEALAKAIGNS
ncbi:DUF6141 family protein [Brevibacillus aydinogluensis]|jgi:hypothetical protein|uniref:BPH-5 domain-containing protein n=1 Tax=Brevibacillus aydinogluensis TaxID=927786 RepID=A0AA48MEC9_9BACL|nr:DUF6141 family protein [Brevibacillus aydinogluensis]CAJ1003976.1 BPH-5 domain-containing protein [Brevibacillus aydinogluensis]